MAKANMIAAACILLVLSGTTGCATMLEYLLMPTEEETAGRGATRADMASNDPWEHVPAAQTRGVPDFSGLDFPEMRFPKFELNLFDGWLGKVLWLFWLFKQLATPISVPVLVVAALVAACVRLSRYFAGRRTRCPGSSDRLS